MNLPIVRTRVLWYGISTLIVLVGVVGLSLFGLRFGIEFRGGTLMSVSWEGERPEASALRQAFDTVNLPGTVVQFGDEKETIFRFSLIDEAKHEELSSSLEERFGAFREDRFETVGPSIGQELRKKSLWSILLVIVSVLVYVAWAFRKVSRPIASWKYGIITIIALLHDTFIPLALFAFLGAAFQIEVSSALVVALLTILGYSVNDTIVVFDRTRENLTRYGSTESFEEIVNRSVNQTLMRSLNTSLTTLLVLVPVFLFGGETIKYFALALIVGVCAGSYSSIFLASPMLVSLYRRSV